MRLFVAVRPPPDIRDELLAMMGGVAAARWQDDDQLHCTLRFIGEVDRHAASAVAEALGQVRHPAIAARLGSLGTFTTRGRPHALWIGVEPVAALTTLHHKVDQALVRAGIAADTRSYVPHITLARLGRDVGSLGAVLGSRCTAAEFVINSLTLYESTLTREAAVYRSLAHYALNGT